MIKRKTKCNSIAGGMAIFHNKQQTEQKSKHHNRYQKQIRTRDILYPSLMSYLSVQEATKHLSL